VGKSGDDSSALIEFTPLWKTIFSHTIYLYNRKFDWLFIVDPIRLVWHTYISHSLTHSLIHWPVHNIPDAPTKRYFFYKKITQKKITQKITQKSSLHLTLFSQSLKESEEISYISSQSSKSSSHNIQIFEFTNSTLPVRCFIPCLGYRTEESDCSDIWYVHFSTGSSLSFCFVSRNTVSPNTSHLQNSPLRCVIIISIHRCTSELE